jgi:Mg2+ and Co2+ transporter CorA
VAEQYDAALERMTATIAAENRDLQYDNKQLNALIKEYEQTLENVMSAYFTLIYRISSLTSLIGNFRNRAVRIQLHSKQLLA